MRSRRPQEAAGTANNVATTQSVDSSLEALGLDVLAAMLSTSQDGVFVVDSDYRILYANPAACELYCRPLQDLRGHDTLDFVAERQRQTALTFWANLRPGRQQTVAGVWSRPDGSNMEVEVTGTLLNVQGRELRVGVVRDVTERQRQVRQAAALAQAASTVSGGDSIDAILEAICDCALTGTRALAAWVRLDDGDRPAAWIGAAGVPNGFGDCLRSAAAMPDVQPITRKALAMGRVAVYADWRQQVERVFGVPIHLKDLPWQAAVLAPICIRARPSAC
jgi:PAS domain S-box-containing protein